MTYAPPFALLMLSTIVDRRRLQNPAFKVHAKHYSQHGYASHMGFFKACGIQYGNSPGQASGSDNYVSVTKQEVVSLRREAEEKNVPAGELVQEDARHLAHVLTRTDKGPLFDTLEYSIREIVRNTVEHSRSPVVEWCAQYWPKMDRVEIAILDRGIGVERSLCQNPALSVKDGRNALNLCLLPGVSRNVYPGAKIYPGNVWQNSGFGLYMTSRLCRLGGDFFIGSAGEGIFLKGSKKEYFVFPFDGTAVRLVLRPKQIPNLRQVLKQFADEGEKIARRMKISLPEASTASRMIRTDFDRI